MNTDLRPHLRYLDYIVKKPRPPESRKLARMYVVFGNASYVDKGSTLKLRAESADIIGIYRLPGGGGKAMLGPHESDFLVTYNHWSLNGAVQRSAQFYWLTGQVGNIPRRYFKVAIASGSSGA
jgi:hypothetical protein